MISLNQLDPQYFPLITPILSGLVSLFAAYCGFTWSRRASDKREKQLSEERLISSTLKTRQDAYAKIYEELCVCRSYFELFIESSNEFKEHEDPDKFGPLTLNLAFLKTYRRHEIWIHASTKEKFQLLFDKMSILHNIALYNALHILKIEHG